MLARQRLERAGIGMNGVRERRTLDRKGTSRASVRPERAAELKQLLLDLAYDASTYLRQHRSRAVRVSAALLLATSLAACGPEPSAAPDAPAVVEPLSQEVRDGLPTRSGRYLLDTTTLSRDEQGVYGLRWRDPNDLSAQWIPARTSLMRLAPSQRDELEVPDQGDPVLHLNPDTPISLVPWTGVEPTPTPESGSGPRSGSYSGSSSSSSRSSGGVHWLPLAAAASTSPQGAAPASTGAQSAAPAYYDPPRQATLAQGAVRGAVVSYGRPSAPERVSVVARSATASGVAVGGAASAKSGLLGRLGLSGPSSGPFSQGVSRAGGFVSGLG